jgi:uncharacterized protein YjbI with pentapeptide repeats
MASDGPSQPPAEQLEPFPAESASGLAQRIAKEPAADGGEVSGEAPAEPLRGARLNGRDLAGHCFEWEVLDGAQLRKANLTGASFDNASLHGADLSGADVSRASFAGAQLANANFRGARGLRTVDLRGVDLSQARGIAASAIARRDTTGSKLPPDLLEALVPVSDASRNARTVFQVMLLGCLYCALTVWSTTDQQVVMNVGQVKLPILDIQFNLGGFFIIAPVLLLLSLVYLHLYLRHVWEGAARLPAYFPDGTSLSARSSPWIMSALIDRYPALDVPARTQVADDEEFPPPARARLVAWGQELIALSLGFWTIPLTIGLFAWRMLTRQDLDDTLRHVLFVWVSIMLAGGFQFSMIRTLRTPHLRPKAERHKQAVPASTVRWIGCAVTVLLGAATYFVAMTDGGLRMFAPVLPKAPPEATAQSTLAATAVKPALPKKELEAPPPEETKGDDEPEIAEHVQEWVGRDKLNFASRSLVGAKGDDAFLNFANLTNADLSLAMLQRATLRNAELNCAKLREAHLDEAFLGDAKLGKADLTGAFLNGAMLGGADLSEAVLSAVDLSGAKGLTTEQLGKACADAENPPRNLPKGVASVKLKVCSPKRECKPRPGFWINLWSSAQKLTASE